MLVTVRQTSVGHSPRQLAGVSTACSSPMSAKIRPHNIACDLPGSPAPALLGRTSPHAGNSVTLALSSANDPTWKGACSCSGKSSPLVDCPLLEDQDDLALEMTRIVTDVSNATSCCAAYPFRVNDSNPTQLNLPL